MTNNDLIQVLEVHKHTAHVNSEREIASMCLELAQKEIPMKIKIIKTKEYVMCPRCEVLLHEYNHGDWRCSVCGQKLDWE